jgi:hypothetical protein
MAWSRYFFSVAARTRAGGEPGLRRDDGVMHGRRAQISA